MSKIAFAGRSYDCGEGESVLECLTAHGVPIPSACHVGVCQTCLMRAVSGAVPAAAQKNLKSTRVAQGYFHACLCRPTNDLEVALAEDFGDAVAATVLDLSLMNRDTARLRLTPGRLFEYRTGQYIRLFKDRTTSRCYSLASVPTLDRFIELHVRRVQNGQVSEWVHKDLQAGDSLNISDPCGDMFYLAGQPERGLCLIGSGCGLGPLYGIARDALQQGHRGPIRLYHGSHDAEGLYLSEELQALAARHANFKYISCVSGARVALGHVSGRVNDVALAQMQDLSGWSVYLCGHPEMAKSAQKGAYLAGASMQDIHADPFLPSGVSAVK